MRTILDLYKLLYENMPILAKDPLYGHLGLCDMISRLQYQHSYITHDEYYLLMNDLKANKPTVLKHSEFLMYNTYPGYWWPITASGYKSRIEFIKHLIKQLENEQTSKL